MEQRKTLWCFCNQTDSKLIVFKWTRLKFESDWLQWETFLHSFLHVFTHQHCLAKVVKLFSIFHMISHVTQNPWFCNLFGGLCKNCLKHLTLLQNDFFQLWSNLWLGKYCWTTGILYSVRVQQQPSIHNWVYIQYR